MGIYGFIPQPSPSDSQDGAMDTCMPKIGAVGWKALLWHCHSDVCGRMASHTLAEA